MMKRFLFGAAMASALLAGCSGGNETAAADNAAAGNDAATIGVTGSPASIGTYGAALVPTPKFVEEAALGDMYEIESSKLALEKASSPEIRQYAQMMVTAHEGTTAALKSAIASGNVGVTPPAALDERRLSMMAKLRDASPDTFDSVYLDQQTTAHREALGLMDSYAQNGDNAALKTLAAETKPLVQSHIDMVAKLDHG